MSDDDDEQEKPIELPHLQEDLYGILLTANKSIDDSGAGITLFFITFGTLLILSLEFFWLDKFIDFDLSDFRIWYIYVGIAFATFYTMGLSSRIPERAAYKKYSRDISEFAQLAKLTKYQLIAKIEPYENLDKVAEQIKTDETLNF